jgi:hypothetical protein
VIPAVPLGVERLVIALALTSDAICHVEKIFPRPNSILTSVMVLRGSLRSHVFSGEAQLFAHGASL